MFYMFVEQLYNIWFCAADVLSSILMLAHRRLVARRFCPKRTQHTFAHTWVGSERVNQNTEDNIFKLNQIIILYKDRNVVSIPQNL